MWEGGIAISQQAIKTFSFKVIMSNTELDFSSYFTLHTGIIAVNINMFLFFFFLLFMFFFVDSDLF